MSLRMHVCVLLLLISGAVFAESSKSLDLSPYTDSVRAQGSGSVTFTATLKNETGSVVSEPVEIWYTLDGKIVKKNTGSSGVATIDVPKDKIKFYLVSAKSGELTKGPVKLTIMNIKLRTAAKYFPTAKVGSAEGKLLAAATHKVGAVKVYPDGESEPAGEWAWAHPRATFNPPNAGDTDLTAKEEVSETLNADKLVATFTIAGSGEVCEAQRALNITAPSKFSSPQDNVFVVNELLPAGRRFQSDADRGAVDLITPLRKVTYTLKDQFDALIDESDWANKKIQIKENVPADWFGFTPAVTWAKKHIKTGNGAWQNVQTPFHEFTDSLEITGFPLSMLYETVPVDPAKPKGRQMTILRPSLRKEGGIVLALDPHNWKVCINEEILKKDVANNVFYVLVTNYARIGNVDYFNLSITYKVDVQ